jgi:hypothetical protein
MNERPIVVAPPAAGGTAPCAALAPLGSTLAWHDAAALRAVAEDLEAADADALVVDGAEVHAATRAMGHRAQVHGHAPVVVAAADRAADLADVVAVTRMVARHLPPVPVVATGRCGQDLAAALDRALEGLDLAPVAPVAPRDLPGTVRALLTHAQAHAAAPAAVVAGGCC